MTVDRKGMGTHRSSGSSPRLPLRPLAAALVALLCLPSASRGQERHAGESGEFDGHPPRLLTVESGQILQPGGAIGLGDTRWSVPGILLELYTDTLGDVLGVANLGLKLGLYEGTGARPAVAVGARGYWSYGGLIDVGVRKAVESFADVTDSRVDLSGVVAFASATWSSAGSPTRYHASFQAHHPIESRFEVRDSEAGGRGFVEFFDGDDVSAMAGIDHRIAGGAVYVLGEAGYSFALERFRFGGGVDVGSRHWRALLGVTWPGVETDVATEARDFVVTPEFGVRYRF